MKKYRIKEVDPKTYTCQCKSCIHFRGLDWFYIIPDSDYPDHYTLERDGRLSESIFFPNALEEVPYIIDTSDIEVLLDV